MNAIRWNARRGPLIYVTEYPSECEVIEDALDFLGIRSSALFNESDESRLLELRGLNSFTEKPEDEELEWHIAMEVDIAALRYMVQSRVCIRPELKIEDHEYYMSEKPQFGKKPASPDGIFMHHIMPPDEFRDALLASAFQYRIVGEEKF